MDKKFTRRHVLYALGLGSAATLVAACQPKVMEVTRVVKEVVKETVVVEGTPKVVEKTIEKVVTAKPVEEAVTLVVETYQWHEAGFREWLEWMSDRMTSMYPNVKIEARSAPYNEFTDKRLIKLQAGTLGDIFQGDDKKIEQWLAIGGIEALNSYMDVEELKAKIAPGVWERIAPKDQLMGVLTLHTTEQVVIYNTKHFEEAGVTMPGQGEQDKWLDMTVKLTNAPERYGVALYTLAKTGRFNEDLYHFVGGFGGQYSEPDGTPTCNTPEMIAAVSFFRKCVESGVTPIGTPKPNYLAMVWNGQISQVIDGSWFFGSAKASNATALDQLSASPLPWPKRRGTHVFNLYQLYGKSKIKDVAADWLKLAWSEESSLKFSEFTGSPHGRPVKLPQNLVDAQPWMPAYQEVLAAEFVSDDNPGFALVREEANEIIKRNGFAAVVDGEVTPEQACENMQKGFEELSNKYGGETF